MVVQKYDTFRKSFISSFSKQLKVIERLSLKNGKQNNLKLFKNNLFRFERFHDMDGIEFFRNLNIRQLARWATGEEQAPDILVIGK